MQNNPAERLKQLWEAERLAPREALAMALACIEELEQQLRKAQEAAQAQSEIIQRDWLSPAEVEGLRQQLETERQERQDMEWERNALRERVAKHIADQLDYWKQEAAR